MEMLGVTYSVNPSDIALIGRKVIDDKKGLMVCSNNLLHLYENKPMWMNSGLLVLKFSNNVVNTKVQNFDAWAIENGEKSHFWTWKVDCIFGQQVNDVKDELRQKLDDLIKVWNSI